MKTFNTIAILFYFLLYSLSSVSIIDLKINKDSRDDIYNEYHITSKNNNKLILGLSSTQLDGIIIASKNDNVKIDYLKSKKNNFSYFYKILKYKLHGGSRVFNRLIMG